MRYHAIPQTVFFRAPNRGPTPRISWRIVDVDAGINDRAWPRKCVATANDEATGRRIADMMNGISPHASHWQAQAEMARANALELEKRWQSVLDHTNSLLRASHEAADILRKQLFDAREQRDEARGELAGVREGWGDEFTAISKAAFSRCLGVTLADHVERLEAFKAARQNDAIGWTAEEVAKLIQDRDEAKAALKASHRELVEARHYWANQGPHDHVVISLAGYNKLVTERDEALAKYQACVDTVSFVDGQWVKTS